MSKQKNRKSKQQTTIEYQHIKVKDENFEFEKRIFKLTTATVNDSTDSTEER